MAQRLVLSVHPPQLRPHLPLGQSVAHCCNRPPPGTPGNAGLPRFAVARGGQVAPGSRRGGGTAVEAAAPACRCGGKNAAWKAAAALGSRAGGAGAAGGGVTRGNSRGGTGAMTAWAAAGAMTASAASRTCRGARRRDCWPATAAPAVAPCPRLGCGPEEEGAAPALAPARASSRADTRLLGMPPAAGRAASAAAAPGRGATGSPRARAETRAGADGRWPGAPARSLPRLPPRRPPSAPAPPPAPEVRQAAGAARRTRTDSTTGNGACRGAKRACGASADASCSVMGPRWGEAVGRRVPGGRLCWCGPAGRQTDTPL